MKNNRLFLTLLSIWAFTQCTPTSKSEEEVQTPSSIGVGAQPIEGAELFFDGTRQMLDEKWEYWEGPGFLAEMPIKWTVYEDPNLGGWVLNSNDPSSKGGKFGSSDIVTKKKFNDFRAHVEFMVADPTGNSGVYLQNRYEIQVLDGDSTTHGMAALINEEASPYSAYNGVGKWNSYDIQFRAARFGESGKITEQPRVTLYFNGQKVHRNFPISQVWGGPKSGLDGGNEGGRGITNSPGGLKLQAEGHNVLYRNIWIKEMDFEKPETDF